MRPADANRHLHESERVYLAIKDKILSGVFLPWARLVELNLAKEFGVSRTPVREALKRLEQESLIANEPPQGLVVKAIGRQEIADFYTVRETLDGLAARLAAPRISEDDVARLRLLVDAMDNALTAGHSDQLVQMNVRFHEIIFDAAGNVWLTEIGRSLHDFVRRLSTDAYRDREPQLASIVDEHRAIVDALARNDAKAASQIAILHMANARAHVLHRSAMADLDGIMASPMGVAEGSGQRRRTATPKASKR